MRWEWIMNRSAVLNEGSTCVERPGGIKKCLIYYKVLCTVWAVCVKYINMTEGRKSLWPYKKCMSFEGRGSDKRNRTARAGRTRTSSKFREHVHENLALWPSWTWRHTDKYGDPYSESVLCIKPIQSAHTHSSEHTHTRSSGKPFMLRRLGSSWGLVPCSRAPRRGIEDGESAVHPLYNPCRP